MELQALVEELSEKLEQQRLEISALAARQGSSGPSTAQPVTLQAGFDVTAYPMSSK